MPHGPESTPPPPQCPIRREAVVGWRSSAHDEATVVRTPAHPRIGRTTSAGSPVFLPASFRSPGRGPRRAVCSDCRISHTARYISLDQSTPLRPDPSNSFESHLPARESGHPTRYACCPAPRPQSVFARSRGLHRRPRSRAVRKNRPFRFRPRRNAARTFPARALPHSRASPRPEFSAPARIARILLRPCPAQAPLGLSHKPPRSVYFFDQKKSCIPSPKIRNRAHPEAHEVLSLGRGLTDACTNSPF